LSGEIFLTFLGSDRHKQRDRIGLRGGGAIEENRCGDDSNRDGSASADLPGEFSLKSFFLEANC
jgi:hypothetical protein